ncbi:aminopeptidase P family protein [Schumannella sp. 10F1B-5-1]|uniref:aminopeptidase P family protein n=1 Tax=Schumannella sp. 10F1B-5-1 TaxID=2590780 RepID=UPI001131F788|nr:aminopeptidase P family protein [Schumannella sp. 10F1B-5-1]TPW73145.1 aminopeptidase P family protein [Schumannella sp. 10F1B-5-1]
MADSPRTASGTASSREQSAPPRATQNRSTTPSSDAFAAYISSEWADRVEAPVAPRDAAAHAAEQRRRISALHPGERLIVPAGPAKVRSNDTDYPYRAHSAFSHLTGWGSDTVPGSVLVLEPTGAGDDAGHDAVLYFRAPAGRGTDEFYANPDIGEFWIGARPSLDAVAAELGLATRDLTELPGVIDAVDATTRLVRGADRDLTDQIDGRRLLAAEGVTEVDDDADAVLARDLSELRLVKDAWEIEQLAAAVAATKQGFDDVIADLPQIIAHPRGERLVEGTFNRRARADGNAVGYDTIAASGPHACILHWTRNDGPVVPGDLILLDAGIELDSLYTADITRTLPISGSFTEVQRRVYDAVLEAADAAFAIVKPGIRFREVHAAAMQVIAQKTAEWGLLPGTAEESLAPERQFHRRYMVHGTSHHLGLDVHDCAQARRDMYLDGIVEPGMVFTIEPGLYFQPDDLTVPEELRGIGVRIEDDILVTESGAVNLSAGIPRTADEVEGWLAGR